MPDLQPGADLALSNSPANVRHFQWNDDYIELLSLRLELAQVKSLVEIGSGLGYLARLFGLYLKSGSVVHGFDPDPAVVEAARMGAAARPFSVGFDFKQAEAHALPMADASADLVISHHVLINVPDARAVVAEMARVVRPGGRVVAFEPNSLVQSLVQGVDEAGYGVEERLKLVRYQLYFEAGKRALGRGDDSVGDHLPRLFAEAGLTQLEVRLSDKSAALVPPYDTDEKRARADELLAWRGEFELNRNVLRECFVAGGGSAAEWDDYATFELAQAARIREAVNAGTYVHPGGMLTYIVIGTKAG